MPRRRLTDGQGTFAGGLNVTADVSQLAENEVRTAENARLTEFGGVTKRGGTQRISAAAIGGGGIVRGGFTWQKSNGAVQELAISSGQLYVSTFVGIPAIWTNIGGTMSGSAQVCFASFRDGAGECVYIADGGPLNKWDGAVKTENIAGTPNVTRIWVYNQRLYGITGDSETLYWSALNNGDSLGNVGAGGGSAIVRTFGKQALQAGLALGDFMALFHVGGISVFSGWTQDDIQIDTGSRGLSSDVGTIAPDTVVAVENEAYFLADRGIYRLTAAGVEPVSSKIESVIAGLNRSLFFRARAVHNKAKREVLFYFPDEGVYAYNYRLGAWTGPWTFTGRTIYSAWEGITGTSLEPHVFLGCEDGFVRQLDAPDVFKDDVLSNQTGGSGYIMNVQLRRLFFGAPAREKAMRFLDGIGDVKGTASIKIRSPSGTATIPIRTRGASVWGIGVWGEAVWGGLGSQAIDEQAWGRGRFFDATIQDEASGESVYSQLEFTAFDYGDR